MRKEEYADGTAERLAVAVARQRGKFPQLQFLRRKVVRASMRSM
jgi:hypothetical protein